MIACISQLLREFSESLRCSDRRRRAFVEHF